MKIEAIDFNRHKNLGIKEAYTLEHIQNQHVVRINLNDALRGAVDYPILFWKDANGKYFPVFLWSIKPEHNDFVKGGQWIGNYVPQQLQLHPFYLSKKNEEDYVLCIQRDSELVSDVDGRKLFESSGSPTKWLNYVTNKLKESILLENRTLNVCSELEKLSLFEEREISVKSNSSESVIGGFYGISRNRFEELEARELKLINDLGGLDLIFSHFVSLNNLHKLVY